MTTGIVRDARYLEHQTAEGHPESPERLAAVYDRLPDIEATGRIEGVPIRPARPGEILRVHSPDHLQRIAATAETEATALTADTLASPGSYEAAILAAGGMFSAIEAVVEGRIQNAFVLARPPGHHAERSRAMGFCLFNTVALGGRYARETLGLDRILIVDWDVHHGNGTQHAFEDDPAVLFFSVHQSPLFPGTGFFTEVGRGPGEGFTINIPLGRGYGDAEYAALFELVLRPAALAFDPSLILVSAGFDTHVDDPVGAMRMTPAGFAALTRSLMMVADAVCGGRLVLVLEGGYNREALADSVMAVIGTLAGDPAPDPATLAERANRRRIDQAVRRYRHVHRPLGKLG